MATKLFVGSLPYSMTDDDLAELFKEFGEVASAKVIFDRETNRSKGFGFVEFNDDAAAKTAIDALNNKEVQGRTIVVKSTTSGALWRVVRECISQCSSNVLQYHY